MRKRVVCVGRHELAYKALATNPQDHEPVRAHDFLLLPIVERHFELISPKPQAVAGAPYSAAAAPDSPASLGLRRESEPPPPPS